MVAPVIPDLLSLLHIIAFILTTCTSTAFTAVPCNCAVFPSSKKNQSNSFKLLHCPQASIDQVHTIPVACHRIDTFVRIGPVTMNVTPLGNTSEIEFGIAPWAFAELMAKEPFDQLQLDLTMTSQSIDALALAGLKELKKLLTRTSVLKWDGCATASLTNLEEGIFNCRSKFDDYLTFIGDVKLVRFIDCQDVPLQFYCIQCLQNPNVSVIRIRPGPPLRQYMIKIKGAMNETSSDPFRRAIYRDPLTLGSCVPGVCSDKMMCRDNAALKEANTITEEHGVTTASTEEDVVTSSLKGAQITQHTDSATNHRSPYPMSTSLLGKGITQTQRFWIVGAILTLIAVFLITSGVLIAITRRQSRRGRKSVRHHLQATHRTNGITQEASPTLTTETKLENLETA